MARNRPQTLVDGVAFTAGDVRDARAVANAVSGCGAVVHLAWVVAPLKTEAATEEINLGGTRNVLDAMAATGCQRLVFSSSVLAYGAVPGHPPMLTETDERRPPREHFYAAHKKEAEDLIVRSGVDAVMVRAGIIAGREVDNTIFRFFSSPHYRFPIQTGTNSSCTPTTLRVSPQRRCRTPLSKLFFNTAAHPATFASAARAIARADDSATALKALRRANTRVVICHGEQDKIVPLASAVDTASLSGALLVTLPKAYHSWVLNTPWTFAEILSGLIAENRLGEDLRSAMSPPRRGVGPDSGGMYRPGALVHDLTPEISVLGRAYPQRRRMYHRYRIWDPLEVADFAAS